MGASIECVIKESLTGDTQQNAFALASFFRASDISCERSTVGYWADKIYFVCNYNDQSVCYIAINEYEPNTWSIQGDDSGDVWYENVSLSQDARELAWKNVDICKDYASCSACGNPGRMTRKKIFGKLFDNVCPVTIKFNNPSAAEIKCMKAIFGARIAYIQNFHSLPITPQNSYPPRS